MRTFGRAMQIIGLLVGFYVMCALLIAVLIALDVFVFSLDDVPIRAALGLVLATIAAIVIVFRGVFVSTRIKAKDLPGVPVTRAEEPVLWQRISDLAAAAGTRPPAEVRLVPDVNAAVLEHVHLFGLVPGKRRMLIGVPLLLALPLPQFDAVIGHELGHYSGKDVRLGPLTSRVRQGVLATLNAVYGRGRKGGKKSSIPVPGHLMFAAIFRTYAEVVFRLTFAASRQQELAADRFAASIAGRENAAKALGELPVIATAYGFYLNRYVTVGLAHGLVPPPAEVLVGFQRLLNDPSRATEIADLRENPSDEKEHRFDSHPPTAVRVAAILALPNDGRGVDVTGPRAVALLRNPGVPFAALGANLLGDKAAGKRIADWETITAMVGAAKATEASSLLVDIVRLTIGRPARVTDFLDLVDAGRIDEILAQIPRSEAAKKLNATGRMARELAKTQVASMLGDWAKVELVHTGRARFRHSWSEISGELEASPGLIEAIDEAITTAIATQPNTAPLRAALHETGIRV